MGISPFTWEIYRFFLKDGALASEVVGTFTQYPLRLAFAVTIHKSQGKTFEKAIQNRQGLEIVYLRAKDEKSHRQVRPIFIGKMEYNGRPFTGLKAYCLTSRGERTFNVDRILEIHPLPG